MTTTTAPAARLSRTAAGMFGAYDAAGAYWMVAGARGEWVAQEFKTGAPQYTFASKAEVAQFIAAQGAK